MTVTVSVRGQVVIPAEIRRRYKIGANTKLEFLDTGGEIVVIPIPAQSFKSSRGMLKGLSTKALIKERRRNRKIEHA